MCIRLLLKTLLVSLWTITAALAADEIPLNTAMGESIVWVPTKLGAFGSSLRLKTTVYMPQGSGPFPVVVINHGVSDLKFTGLQARSRYPYAALEFLRRGYVVVLPNRHGFAGSEGAQNDPGCYGHEANGQEQADSVVATLDWIVQQPWADKDRMLITGSSQGGLATVAMSTRNYPGVKGLINFAAGVTCNGGYWQSSLVEAMHAYGKKASAPMLWIYGENDRSFKPDLAREMLEKYNVAGGKARLALMKKFFNDGHGLLASSFGATVWWPEAEKYLRESGLPTEIVNPLPDSTAWHLTPVPPKTNFAKFTDNNAVPGVNDAGRAAYRTFRNRVPPRAFALGANGVWGTAYIRDGDDPLAIALRRCQFNNDDVPCRLYAVDEDVVW